MARFKKVGSDDRGANGFEFYEHCLIWLNEAGPPKRQTMVRENLK
jgi:hypothetical protein